MPTWDQLVDRIRRSDPVAIRSLVEQFEGPGRRLAAALLGDAHLAEDAVQEAFVEAIRRIEQLREPQALPAWFRQIVRTQANRVARRSKQPREIGADVPARDCSPPDELIAAETQMLVRSALAELPRTGRETAERFYLREHSLAEIAQELNVPLGTVKRRLHDARSLLRDLLLGLPESSSDVKDDRQQGPL